LSRKFLKAVIRSNEKNWQFRALRLPNSRNGQLSQALRSALALEKKRRAVA
jgi:hypothetical protein